MIAVAGTLQANGKAAGSATQQDAESGMLIAAPVSRSVERPRGDGLDTLIAHSLRGEGFDASEDGAGRGTPLVPIYTPEVAATMVARSSRGGGQTNSPGHQADHELIAFSCKDHGADAGNTAPTLRAMNHTGSHANAGGQVAVAVSLRGRDGGATAELGDEVQNCLRASGGGGDKAHILAAMQVRRLTPRECERLQDFPDDYTLVPVRGKPAADGPRYKALGNSMNTGVMKWIGQRIQLVDDTAVDLVSAA